MTRYARMFERLQERREGAFVPFVVLGDPTPTISRRIIAKLIESGADCLELGIPFSDPIADGPTIQTATVRALEAGVTPEACWEILADVRASAPDLSIGLLVYANLVAHRDPARFYGRAARTGVDSVLVADVPTLEAAPFVDAALAAGVDPVLIAPPNADDARLQTIARFSRGYTYVVTRAGVTGADQAAGQGYRRLIDALRAHGSPPCMVGFGISEPSHVRTALDCGAAGAISGSAVVSRITANLGDEAAMLDSLGRFVRDMKAATRRAG